MNQLKQSNTFGFFVNQMLFCTVSFIHKNQKQWIWQSGWVGDVSMCAFEPCLSQSWKGSAGHLNIKCIRRRRYWGRRNILTKFSSTQCMGWGAVWSLWHQQPLIPVKFSRTGNSRWKLQWGRLQVTCNKSFITIRPSKRDKSFHEKWISHELQTDA